MESVREGELNFRQDFIRSYHRWVSTCSFSYGPVYGINNRFERKRAFRSADFTRGIIISWIMQAVFGSVLLFPLLLQQIRGFAPLTTGLILLPQAVGSMIFMPLAESF